MCNFISLLILKKNIFILLLSIICLQSVASDTINVSRKRKIILGVTSVGITAGTLVYLNQAWYQQYNTGSFHFFNDNNEWLQMDKCGHAFSTYQTGRLMMRAMNWAGYNQKQKLFIGGLSGFAYMSTIEVMDGYSQGWGFSWGDMGANAIGSGLAIGQELLWKEQRMQLKYSYSASHYALYNPSLLGNSFSQQLLKDYNAQTYWLSVNPSSFMRKDAKFPKWLNFAFGYGANGMIGAFNNNLLIKDGNGNTLTFNRYRQFYLSLDADLTRIPVKSKLLKSVFLWINMIKIPFPNIELSNGMLKANYY